IDFAVMRDVAERMRQRPARERVRAEALVNDGQRGDEARVHEIREIDFDLLRREHSFVDQGPRGETFEINLGRRLLDALTNEVEFAFEIVDALEVLVALDESLL